jgi:hypothetical protein
MNYVFFCLFCWCLFHVCPVCCPLLFCFYDDDDDDDDDDVLFLLLVTWLLTQHISNKGLNWIFII